MHKPPSDAEILEAVKAAVDTSARAFIAVQRGEVIGLAADGVTVTFGVVLVKADVTYIVRYLQNHPSREEW